MYKNEKGYEEDNWPKTFLSNIKRENISIIFQASYETGFDIFIKEEATTIDGYPLPDYVEVHTNELGKCYTTLWNRYAELKEEG